MVRRPRRPALPAITVLAALLVVGVVLSGCGKSLSAIVGSTSTTQDPVAVAGATPSTTTPPLSGEVAVAFPVAACSNGFGSALPSQGWKPSILLAPIPTVLVGKVEFYTDGTHTLLGPEGWNCSEWAASPGATGLVVYPSNTPAPGSNAAAAAGTEGVFATFDTTGRPSGIAAVCPYFTIPQWQQQEADCSGSPPAGEQSAVLTPDVASVTDPSGVTGTLQGSGGSHPVTGVVVFPQVESAVTNGSPVNIAEESCSLVDVSLCPTVISDFEVREFPVPSHG
jgi:hypothetical protein